MKIYNTLISFRMSFSKGLNDYEYNYITEIKTALKGILKLFMKGLIKMREILFRGKRIGYGEWIPCREQLPESDEPEMLCLVTYQDYDIFEGKWGCRKLGIMSYLMKQKIWNTKALINVLAWIPLPEPFKLMEEKEND